MKTFVSGQGILRRKLALLSIVGWVLATLLPTGAAPQASAQTGATAPVWYDQFAKIIYIGSDYIDPVFAAYPSRADAPKDPITVPQLKDALDLIPGAAGLVVDQGAGNWLIKSDVVVSPTARLEMTDASIKGLRLDSTPNRFPAYTKLVATGGHLLFSKVKVTSWDTTTNAVDTNYYDGRSYLLAQIGARMDIIDSEVSYLGMGDGEPSGLSWRKRATPLDPRTGATGEITRSDIHHNYFGQYSYEAYALKATYNKFRDNVFYGFDPHDFSIGFEVAYNQVYGNGKHGIIFSRGCEQNWIHHNTVYSNAEHGIMLDRGSNNNKISDNIVYNNRDAVAIFQSSDNLIQANNLYNNERGVRINATYDPNDEFDGNSVRNVVIGNTIKDNTQYGIYLYERGDKNVVVSNVIEGNAQSGVYIKTGENKLEKNTIRTNGTGVTIIGSEAYAVAPTPLPPTAPAYVPAESAPGQKNTLYGNIIADNNGVGVQIKAGYDNLVGPKSPDVYPQYANQINTNGTYGVTIDTASIENTVVANTIQGNGTDGVLVKGAESVQNRISRNSIVANGRRGITLSEGANAGIAPPTVTSAPEATTVTGAATPKGTVEVYRDANGQGRVYKGTAIVDAQGNWSFPLPAGDNAQEGGITALAFDKSGNTSQFGSNTPVGATQAIYEIGTGINGDTTIFVSGPGSNVTLPMIQAGVQAITTTELLKNEGSGVWQSNASLFINRGVTLTLKADTASWLKLRSQDTNITLADDENATYNYKSFVTLRTYNGVLSIDGARVTSWDPTTDSYDTDVSNGRAYVLAKYNARLDINNADLSYLGSADGESYGVAWRDINSSDAPDELLTRVTGNVLNSTFSYNYYGIYTFQASYMVFRGNKFHNNIGYGFDPHDLSHHFTVDSNEAFENGNHGFIISRGCNNFTFTKNKSYNNSYTVGNEDRNAHGFMLDPGSPNSQFAQVPSYANTFDANEAWGNSGYGLRIVGSTDNKVLNNTFTNNLQGITVEQGSTGNVITKNTITGSGIYGIYLTGGSDNTTISGNAITKSGKHGIYIKTGGNAISGNTISENGTVVDGVSTGSGIATLPETTLALAAADLTLPGATTSVAEGDPDLLAVPAQASELKGNVISGNAIANNVDEGIELKGALGTVIKDNAPTTKDATLGIYGNGSNGIYLASGTSGTMISGNAISDSKGYGIRANGSDTVHNTWSKNLVFNNGVGGIITTSDANNDIQAPVILTQKGNKISGTAAPGARVELYSDPNGQASIYETVVTAKADGTWSSTRSWKARYVNATATDAEGNSSGFALNMPNQDYEVYLPLIVKR
ncbi:MAG: right-handed parallel beta-helix repeat-containing protein [Chloroflexales bacterium]|nr:right-handed parallel beta-helix repeat-containing protein [Chloroflexales bacterium]